MLKRFNTGWDEVAVVGTGIAVIIIVLFVMGIVIFAPDSNLAVQMGLNHSASPLAGGGTATIVTLPCPEAYETNLYDTPSGNLDAGYYDASTTKPVSFISSTSGPSFVAPTMAAHIIGLQAFAKCTNASSTVIVPIPITQYVAFTKKDAAPLQVSTSTTALATFTVQ